MIDKNEQRWSCLIMFDMNHMILNFFFPHRQNWKFLSLIIIKKKVFYAFRQTPQISQESPWATLCWEACMVTRDPCLVRAAETRVPQKFFSYSGERPRRAWSSEFPHGIWPITQLFTCFHKTTERGLQFCGSFFHINLKISFIY